MTGALLGGVACGRSEPVRTDPNAAASPSSPTPTAASPTQTSTSAQSLSTLLVRPPGFVGIPDDPVTGPISSRDVGNIFVDHPSDVQDILSHGFVAGYTSNWKQPAATFDPGTMPDPTISNTTVIGAMVLQFDTEEHARAVLSHFRVHNLADGYQTFAVPESLVEGYGARRGPDSIGIRFFGVGWVHGVYLLNLTAQYTDPAADSSQVIALARAQEAALRP